MMTAEQAVQEMVHRIVSRFNPQKVILFGSRARGDARGDSDIDLLVVLPEIDGPRRRKVLEIRRELHGIGIGKDIVLRTPDELETEKEIVGTIGRIAWREGRTLYERPH